MADEDMVAINRQLMNMCLDVQRRLDLIESLPMERRKLAAAETRALQQKIFDLLENEKPAPRELIVVLALASALTIVAMPVEELDVIKAKFAAHAEKEFDACTAKRRRSGLIAEPKARTARAGK
jgi:hypothetical protein